LSWGSATLTGTVNPKGKTVSDCHFDWGTTSAYGNSVPCASPPGSGASAAAVSADLSGLAPGTTYHFRAVASNAAGTNLGADKTFATTACHGEGEVRFGVVDAIGGCFTPVAAGGHNAYATTDPAPGATIVLDPQGRSLGPGWTAGAPVARRSPPSPPTPAAPWADFHWLGRSSRPCYRMVRR
jgi:hypothetical protein